MINSFYNFEKRRLKKIANDLYFLSRYRGIMYAMWIGYHSQTPPLVTYQL